MLAIRRGSGIAAKAAARLCGETASGRPGIAMGAHKDVASTVGSFAGCGCVKHIYPRKRAPSSSPLAHKPCCGMEGILSNLFQMVYVLLP